MQGIGVDVEPLNEILKASHVTLDQDETDLTVLLVDHYLQPEISKFNESFLASGHPWFIAKPFGGQIWLGPYFVPGRTACWSCLHERLQSNRPVESYLRTQKALSGTAANDRAERKQAARWRLAHRECRAFMDRSRRTS